MPPNLGGFGAAKHGWFFFSNLSRFPSGFCAKRMRVFFSDLSSLSHSGSAKAGCHHFSALFVLKNGDILLAIWQSGCTTASKAQIMFASLWYQKHFVSLTLNVFSQCNSTTLLTQDTSCHFCCHSLCVPNKDYDSRNGIVFVCQISTLTSQPLCKRRRQGSATH